jgi:hypothetical protein
MHAAHKGPVIAGHNSNDCALWMGALVPTKPASVETPAGFRVSEPQRWPSRRTKARAA